MIFQPTEIAGAWSLLPERAVDERGSFARLFCRQEFAAHDLAADFVQASTSVTKLAGTIRGMHFQRPPHAEVKLIRCVRGAIHDVIADLRCDSPTYRRWQRFLLTARDGTSVYAPAGCAHGFQTLENDTEVLYFMNVPFAPDAADGFRYDDPAFAIEWMRPVTLVAEKDLRWTPFR